MVKTILELRQKYTDPDGSTELCLENNFVYEFDAGSVAADDNSETIRPVLTAAGRWIKLKEYVESEL